MELIRVGVVEDINDNLSLGRVRVRIIGLHTPDKFALPTSSLAWSMPLNPTAQISGIGSSGCNFLPGSWVLVGSFDDTWQTTIVFGALQGIPQDIQSTYDISGDSVNQMAYKVDADDMDPNAIPTDKGGQSIIPSKDSKPQAIGPLSSSDVNKLKATIKRHESGGNYSALNQLGFIGAYQFGGPVLVDLGYCRRGTNNKDLKYSESWLGKNGVVSRDTWFTNQDAQETAMDALLARNFKTLYNKGLLRNDSDRDHVCGALMVAHLQGAGGAAKWLRGGYVKDDANGTSCSTYYKYGHTALTGKAPSISRPSVEQSLPPTTAKASSTVGFSDPNGIYPKRSLIQEQDVNRLARGESLSGTIIGVKEADRTKHTRIAGTQSTWDQPRVPANPTYPNNQVSVTHGGIITEHDSTPDNVRIHTFHPSGTFSEIDNNGTKVNKIVGDGFTIIERNGNVMLKGNLNITVEGDCNLLVQNNMTAEVYGDADIIVKNDLNTTVHGNFNHYVQGEYNIKCKNYNLETFDGDVNVLSAHNIDMKCVDNWDMDVGKQTLLNSMDSVTLVTENVCSLRSKSKFNINTSDELLVQSTKKTSIKAGPSIDMDATEIFQKAGTSVNSNKPTILHMDLPTLKGTVPLPNTPQEVIIRDLNDPLLLGDKLTRQELLQNDVGIIPPTGNRFEGPSRRYESPEDMDDNFQPYMDDLKSKAEFDPNESIPSVSETYIPTKKNGKIEDYKYDNFTNEEDIATGVQISKNYSLRQYLAASDKIKKIQPQMGLSVGQIVQNIQYLSVNVMEKILAEYPMVIITSGYRYKGGSSMSKHYMGMAVDMQFPGKSKSEYYSIAKRITEILPAYDQVLLEYKNYGSGMPWIHVSFNKNSNREMVLTLFNNKTVHQGLAQMA